MIIISNLEDRIRLAISSKSKLIEEINNPNNLQIKDAILAFDEQQYVDEVLIPDYNFVTMEEVNRFLEKSGVKNLNAKSVNSILNTGFLNVWEGAVRSGKTVCSIVSFLMYIFNCPKGQDTFIMAGRTVSSLTRNVILGEFGMLAMLGSNGRYFERNGSRIVEVNTGKNGIKLIYCFGASDNSSHEALRGMTATGAYCDEVSTFPNNFIVEMFNRTVVSEDRRHFWTLNPEVPTHFIYSMYIDNYKSIVSKGKDIGGYYWWHFDIYDNPALDDKRRNELAEQYSGIFYRRFILGERVAGDGVIYDMYTVDNTYTNKTRPKHIDNDNKVIRYIAIDAGTANPTVYLDIRDDGKTIWIEREYYHNSRSEEAKKFGSAQKTDKQYVDDLIEFMGKYDDSLIIIDSQALSMKAEMRSRNLFPKDADKDVINGIRSVASMLGQKKIMVNVENCPNTNREFSAYMWDDKAVQNGKEAPKKVDDHAMDALRYFIYTIIPPFRRGSVS